MPALEGGLWIINYGTDSYDNTTTVRWHFKNRKNGRHAVATAVTADWQIGPARHSSLAVYLIRGFVKPPYL